mgnify:CR=1 FL=1|tara:strand:+ start:25058 stop:25828 length:771 start_codon:yes stop_codon:yes gene_type:complete
MGALELSLLIPALCAGLLVISTHVPLGRHVLAGGIVFIDLAVAQVAGLGVTAAAAIGFDASGWKVQVAAVAAALLGALLLNWTERRWPSVQEALIGVLFVFAASVELLLLANNPHGGEHLKDLLVGQILWVSIESLWPIAVIYAAVLAVWFLARHKLGRIGFYVLFALVVTQSVQLVGIYLVFATLIAPALAARFWPDRFGLMIAYGVALGGYVIGLLASAAFDLPTGAVIVVAIVVLMALSILIHGPEKTPAVTE